MKAHSSTPAAKRIARMIPPLRAVRATRVFFCSVSGSDEPCSSIRRAYATQWCQLRLTLVDGHDRHSSIDLFRQAAGRDLH
jgi:hypothetical protein